MKNAIFLIIAIPMLASRLYSQSGGNYQIVQSVTGNGGETSSGGPYSTGGTSGQTVTERSSQGPYSLDSGFWTPTLAPTAASVSVSGQVHTPGGGGLRNAVVQLVSSNGTIWTTRTGAFGYFSFNQIATGQTAVINVSSKQFQSRVVLINDAVFELDFFPISVVFR